MEKLAEIGFLGGGHKVISVTGVEKWIFEKQTAVEALSALAWRITSGLPVSLSESAPRVMRNKGLPIRDEGRLASIDAEDVGDWQADTNISFLWFTKMMSRGINGYESFLLEISEATGLVGV